MIFGAKINLLIIYNIEIKITMIWSDLIRMIFLT
jgi:hypothetical protein